MSDIQILSIDEAYIKSFYTCLKTIANEKNYLEMVDAPPIDQVSFFQKKLIVKGLPGYYALDGKKMIGWVDVFLFDHEHHSHRGSLGMGLLKEYRGQGLGTQLLEKAIEHAKNVQSLEKIELTVFTSNERALKLYKKFGFKEIGINHKYRKVGDQYFDALTMELFV